MFSIFNYIYYRIYIWQKRFGKESMPEFTAVLGVSQIQYFFIILFLIIFEISIKKYIIVEILSKYTVVGFGLFLAAANSYIYLKDKKYLVIEKKYKNISKSENIKLYSFMWMIISLLICFFLFILMDALVFDFAYKNKFYNF